MIKLSKQILINFVLVCIIAQGATLSRICVGKTHCDAGTNRSGINWAGICHAQDEAQHRDHDCVVDHDDGRCIDISINPLAGPHARVDLDQCLLFAKAVILKHSTSLHPFASADFSRRCSAFFPVFSDTTDRSIESTILII